MTRNMWIIGSVCALALAVGVYSLLPSRQAAPDGASSSTRPPAALQSKDSVPVGAESRRPARVKASAKPGGQPKAAQGTAAARGPVQDAAGAGQPEVKTAREQAVESWDALIDTLAEQPAAPTPEQAQRVKESLHKLDKEDQLDGVQNALNLLPDEQFAVLYPVLFDKTENPEILDAIFSDALNRDEELKVPLMKELYKDKTHPMYTEAARILDATGELDEMNGQNDSGSTAAQTP